MEDQKTWQDLRFVLVPPETSINDLPICLVGDILSRLPAKTLIRSTSVSTTWYNLIRNRKFISMHLHRSISKSSEKYFIITPEKSPTNSCSLISEKTFKEESRLEIPFETKSGLVKMYGSCNGLICLGDGFLFSHGRDLYLWNPLLKKYRHIDNSAYPGIYSDPVSTFSVIGFGYNDSDSDHKILRIFFRADSNCNFFGLKPRVEIYSVRNDSWKKIECNVPRILNYQYWIYLDGFIYFKELKKTGTEEWIVSFDLKKEVFEEIKFPKQFRRRAGKKAHAVLKNYKGLVSICGFDLSFGGQTYSIWVLIRDEKGLCSWIEEIRAVSKIPGMPLMFTSTGLVILETVRPSVHDFTDLALCDLKKKEFKMIGNDGPYTGDVSFVESLVLLESGKLPVKRYKLVNNVF